MKTPNCEIRDCPNPGVPRVNGEQTTFICNDHFGTALTKTEVPKTRVRPKKVVKRAPRVRPVPKPKVQEPRKLIRGYVPPASQPSITQKTTGILSNQYIRFGAPVGVFLLALLIVMGQASGNQEMTKQLNNFSSIGLYGFFLVVGFYLGHRAKKEKTTSVLTNRTG